MLFLLLLSRTYRTGLSCFDFCFDNVFIMLQFLHVAFVALSIITTAFTKSSWTKFRMTSNLSTRSQSQNPWSVCSGYPHKLASDWWPRMASPRSEPLGWPIGTSASPRSHTWSRTRSIHPSYPVGSQVLGDRKWSWNVLGMEYNYV